MNWDSIASFALLLVTFMGMNLGGLRWMLDRHQAGVLRDFARWEELEHAVFELRASLPLEYVRREDWIRFSVMLDAKFDGLREEMRQEIGAIKDKLYV